MRSQEHLVIALCAALLCVHAGRARAAERAIVLVDPGPELEGAVRAALEPWGAALRIVPGPSPGPSAPESNAAARALALAHDADVVAWVSEHDGGYALWVYDRETDHVIERALAQGPPFDAAAAAAVALSLKTLLRHSAAAPPAERYGVGADRAASGASSAGATTDEHAGAARDERATAGERAARGSELRDDDDDDDDDEDHDHDDAGDDDDAAASPSVPAIAPSLLELALAGGARALATDPRRLEPRFAIAASYWPERGSWGIVVGANGGPLLVVHDDGARFDGKLLDGSGRLALALRRDLAHALRASAALIAALHVLALDGSLRQTERDADATRLSPELALAVAGDLALLARARIGLFAELGYLLRAERYRVEQRTVLEVEHVSVSMGISLSFGLVQ